MRRVESGKVSVTVQPKRSFARAGVEGASEGVDAAAPAGVLSMEGGRLLGTDDAGSHAPGAAEGPLVYQTCGG